MHNDKSATDLFLRLWPMGGEARLCCSLSALWGQLAVHCSCLPSGLPTAAAGCAAFPRVVLDWHWYQGGGEKEPGSERSWASAGDWLGWSSVRDRALGWGWQETQGRAAIEA